MTTTDDTTDQVTAPPMTAEAIAVDRASVAASYLDLVDLLIGSMHALRLMPLAEMADVNDELLALGPRADPAAYYRRDGDNLHDQRRVIDAALHMRLVPEDLTDRQAR